VDGQGYYYLPTYRGGGGGEIFQYQVSGKKCHTIPSIVGTLALLNPWTVCID